MAKYLLVIAALSTAVLYGRSQSKPDVAPYVRGLFPNAAYVEESDGIYTALDKRREPLGWAGVGSASGYGGPTLVVVGIDTEARIVGSEVVEHRETPLFFEMARSPRFFAALTGTPFEQIDYNYERVVGVTGASKSVGAITAAVRAAVAKVATGKFDIPLRSPEHPFEFGIIEITLVLLFGVGVASQYLGGLTREILRWACQLCGLLILGFWTNSPLTIAKLAMLVAGYFPSLRANVSLYLLITGFMVTVFVFGTSIYCSHLCPFGAAQRCIGVIGGKKARLPPWSVRHLHRLRNVIVFLAVCGALLVSKPAQASYEPFAVMFALKGTMLQWFLLLIVVLASLIIQRPWCRFFCPMRVCERILQDVRQTALRRRRTKRNERRLEQTYDP